MIAQTWYGEQRPAVKGAGVGGKAAAPGRPQPTASTRGHSPPGRHCREETRSERLPLERAGQTSRGADRRRRRERELERLRGFGEPIADVIGPHAFCGWQAAFDPLLTPGARNYWKSHNFLELSDDLVEIAVDYLGTLPSDQSEIFFARLGGAINRVPSDATAYPHRDAEYVMNVHTRWDEPGDDAACVAWARRFFVATEPLATGGVYVNFIPEDEERVPNAYGANYARLQELKRKYDPDNLFRLNQNINP